MWLNIYFLSFILGILIYNMIVLHNFFYIKILLINNIIVLL